MTLAAAAACWLAAAAPPSNAQQRVDQGYGDVDQLQISLRIVPESFRADTGFEHVYRAPDGRLYRVAGAIHAVFERSDYVATPRGGRAVIPAGTVFHIVPPDWASPEGQPFVDRAGGDLGETAVSSQLSGEVFAGTERGAALARPVGATPVSAAPPLSATVDLHAGGSGRPGGGEAAGRAPALAADLMPTVADENVRRARLAGIASRYAGG